MARRIASDRTRFYEILDDLRSRIGAHRLRDCTGRMPWPSRGVYFFYEDGETRANGEPRVVRIGTHGVSTGSKTTLWKRLSQHQGTMRTGGGNHRGSVFRRHIGSAMIARGDFDGSDCSSWSNRVTKTPAIRAMEFAIEQRVSDHLREMPFLWIIADDEAGASSLRGYIERNSIALLSRQSPAGAHADPPSATWLGRSCPSEHVQHSGLWNVRHTTEHYDPAFLDTFSTLATQTAPLHDVP